ncbi:MAG TPA: carboxyl transferase domain-containing protein [Solirubrobacteraceae bacterium]|nr:carboxyl transferase domain-containing protein [Solirubrobacteraceae bacterium]
MQRPFTRLAIVNRGEPAMRVIHAVRELNEHSPEPITLIALYTAAERDAMFVRHADEAVCLGPSTIEDADGGSRRSGYLDYPALERALVAARADAAWVGWGFVAEQPEFAELCERLGIVFIGPDPGIMRLVGDKIAAKRLAEDAGVPVAPWSNGAVETVEEAVHHAEWIGFPLMIKAAAGGGGRGIRRVDDTAALASAFASARAEAFQAFGDGTLLLEKLVTDARHIEVQIIADGQGTAWPIGVRDCSYQRRNQKVIEESASPALSAEQEQSVMEAARRLALLAGYRNAGTVEFLYEPKHERFSFMEVNARLQVEHPVTEAVTGIDLVKLQLHVAAGGRLEGDPPAPIGHAIEARLNAEDPALGFAPAPGRLVLLRLPTGPGLRVDTGVSEGDVIPPEFDSMIGKLIAWGRTRDEALARLRCAVADTVVVVDGGTTNQGFLLELLSRPEVWAGNITTSWLDHLYLSGEAVPSRDADIALLQAAIELSDDDLAADRARFYAFARRGRPHADTRLSRTYELRFRGQSYRLSVAQIGPGEYRVTVDGQAIEITARRLGPHERRLEVAGKGYRTLTSAQGDDLLVEVGGVPHRISRDDGGIVHNISPAVVVSIPVVPGDIVEAGDVVAVVEAMKMESSLTAPFRGRVKRVLAGENTHVAAQAPLVSLEPIDGDESAATSERLSFARYATDSGATAPELCRENLRRMERLLLGYDIGREEADRMIGDLHGQCADLLACDPALIPGEHGLLTMFADLRTLTLPRHLEDETEPQIVQSPEENLNAWLRSFETEAEGLASDFVVKLRRALAHYGIDSLDRTSALEECCYRLFLSQQRVDAARAAVVAILDRRLDTAEELIGHVGDDFREALDRLVVAHEGRDPVIADLARQVRFRYFDERIIAEARESVYAEMQQHVFRLTTDPETPDRDALIAAIVDCPRPLSTLLTASMRAAQPRSRNVLVEAMARRYYRVRSLEGFDEVQSGPHTFVRGRYSFQGQLRHIGAAYVELEDVASAVAAFMDEIASVPDAERAVLDLYAEHRDAAPSHEELAHALRLALADVAVPPSLHRVVIAVAEPRRGRGMSAVDMFTFRPGPDGLVEDEVLRGLHPMMGHRLQVWRLQEFHLERLPSPEDIYTFRGVAHTNPRDERLFACAEVRDLTRIYDDEGNIVALPELEQVVIRVLATVREFQAHRPLNRRLLWNRVLLHVWPVMEPDPDEIQRLVERLAPLTTGLGIEMISFQGQVREPDGSVRRRVLQFFTPLGHDVSLEVADPPTRPIQPLDEGARRLISARRRGTLHPAEVIRLLAPSLATAGQPAGVFTEYELGDDGTLSPIERPPANNPCGIVVGTVRNFTERYPEGMLRVILLGDPTRALGALAEPECRRINAAIDLAESLGVPLEWFALSAGAKIAMDSGTETMDWIGAVLRRIVQFTQAGGELNVVVAGINVGAQPYWNAEATMLMHTRGVLIMTPESAMVLTGKQALDYSGGVSAENNFGIGGYERIMGPNGQAQYWARDLADACRVLLTYYEHAYVAPGERFPRPAITSDPTDRDIRGAKHTAESSDLVRIGDVFSDATNPGRKKPFDIRAVMRAVIDSDLPPFERWPVMNSAEIAVVWDAHLGGVPVSLIGIEGRPLPRHGPIPADGPEQWTSGTLFPRSSKKIARAINSVAGRRPLVVLANLAGFDGSPESMREWQLEFGAEIGRAVVNFDGPIVFCVVSRYHGGAFVVFSQTLNPNLETIALEGAHASVIGGAPAAAVVFAREVEQAVRSDERITALDERIASCEGAERQRLRAERAALWPDVLAEKRKEFADRFDATHSVERAVRVGSVSAIVDPKRLRPFLIEAVERGMRRALEQVGEERDGHARLAR